MLHTPVCDLLGVQFPIIQAGMASFTSAELVAAVSNAGGLGSLGAAARSTGDLERQLARLRDLTSNPFAINHTLTSLNEDSFVLSLRAKPAVISFALGDPGDFVKRAHDAGSLVMHQVTTVRQARQAAERGVDLIIAQGSEAGGFGGIVAGLPLIPQVVDAVAPIPVMAAGGIADGRGLAAALILGAQGVNIGSRFLASVEAPISEKWKQAIVAAESEDPIKAEFWNDIMPPGNGLYVSTPRVLHSPFVDQWYNRRDDARKEAESLRAQVVDGIRQGTWGDLLPFTGQSAGEIHEILPAGEIVRRLVAEAEQALARAPRLLA